jgi:ATP-dependent exoDNAse (exonuclease V) beta subunit
MHELQKKVENEDTFERQGFKIIKASAGSGKTYRLVRDYLACSLWEDQPHFFKHILAITFTNKAAQEMKDRILKDVREVAEGKGSMRESLLEVMPIDAPTLQRRARALSETMMHYYEDFSVMTIDSFVNRLVRSFAKDLKWEEDFQIELDEAALIDEAVSRLLSRIGKPGEEALTAMLEGFVRQQVEEEANVNFRSLLTKFGKQVTKESMQDALNVLDPEVWTPEALESYRKRQYKALQSRRAVPVNRAREALDRLKQLGLTDADFSYGSMPKWLHRVANGAGRAADLGVRLQGQITGRTYWKSTADADVIDRIEQAIPELESAVEAWQGLYTGPEGRRFKLLEHLQERVSLIGTLGLIREELEAVQLERNVRLLSTLNQQIASIVRDNPAPFIFERIGNRYHHIFIDEFQDTSITQWHNLVQLFEHLVASGKMGMVVGDGKQAIYRWRNGNYEQLEKLPVLIGDPSEVLKEAAATLGMAAVQGELVHNRRSGASIVDWNNRWFKQIQSHLPEKLKSLYDDVAQTSEATFSGAVHMATMEESNASERQEARNRWVLDRIVHHTGGRLEVVDGKERYVAPEIAGDAFGLSDIAVLLRRNRDGALLAQYLLDKGIAPWTSESLHLGRHPAPLGVVALLQMTLDPDNPALLLTFVQCYCAIHPEVSEVELLTRHHRLLEIEKSNGGRFEMGQLNGASLLEEVASDLRLQDWVTAPLTALIGHCFEALGWGKVFPAYAEGMLELAHEAMGQRKGTLSDFLTFWDRVGHRRSIRVSGGSNAVQIMTPHKAKGLDFKVVITSVHPENIDQFKDEIPVLLNSEEFELPAALLRNSDMKDTDLDGIRLEEIERTVVDALNVAYVTMTRAVERLDVNLELTSLPALDMEIKTLPQLLWKGWQEAFAPSPSQVAPAEFGIPDRKRRESDAEKIIVEQSTQELLLGQPFAQKIARPRVNWSEVIPAGEWTPQQFGTALHSVMSLVHGAEDWPAVRTQIQSSALGPETERLIQVVDAILSHPKIKPYFDAPSGMVFAERSLGLGAGEVVRPDRVVRLPDGWHVIDFKTGAPKDRDDAQVRSYCLGIFEMHPEEAVHGWLIYTDPLQVKEVPLLFGVL